MMKSKVSNAASLVLVLVAASSLLSMIGLTQVDRIINRDLYIYGLKFSYEWALPYWTMTSIIFGMGWFNIIIAIAFQLYLLLSRRTVDVPTAQTEALKLEVPSIPQPVKSKQLETEKFEETKKPEETPTPKVETKQKLEEETPKTVEDTTQREPLEAKPSEEGQKEQEEKPTESAEPKTEETPTPSVETQTETQEKSEETPILVGVPEVEI